MKNIVILGANGLVGGELIKSLHGKYEILRVSRTGSNGVMSFDEFIKRERFDLDAAIYLAARIPKKTDSLLTKLALAFLDLRDFLRFMFKYGSQTKVIFFSSVSVFGESQTQIDLGTKECPDSLYGFSKLVMENILNLYANVHIIRPSSIFGDKMKRNTFLPYILDSIKKHSVINLFGQGLRKQNYVSVKIFGTLVSALLAGTEKRTLIYSLGEQEHSNLEVAELIVQKNGQGSIQLKGEDLAPSRNYTFAIKKSLGFCSTENDFEGFIISQLRDGNQSH